MRKMQGYDFLWLFVVLNCYAIAASKSVSSSMEFTIDRTWDDVELYSNQTVDIKLSGEDGFVIMEIFSPFYNDKKPDGEPGKPFPKLWEYEVVEAFFLGADNMYLEVEFSPHGQYLVLFLAGPKNPVKMLLPLEYTAKFEKPKSWNDLYRWYGKAKIPVEYFPPSVNKFNAYAIYGEGFGRRYKALFPAPKGRFNDPDFHRLGLFQSVDFSGLFKRDKQLSKVWKEALDEEGIEYDENLLNSPENTLEYRIITDWEEELVDHCGVNIKFRREGDFVVMDIFSRFYFCMKPKGNPGKPTPNLWNYEIVRAFFLGSSSMYLDVEFSPYGHYLVVLVACPKNPIKMSLTLEYTANIKGRYWSGKAKIPVSYFPPRCNLFNVYAQYGHKLNRRLEALFPCDRKQFRHPEFIRFQYYKVIDKMLLHRDEDFSKVWRKALSAAGLEYRVEGFYVPEAKSYEPYPELDMNEGYDKILDIDFD